MRGIERLTAAAALALLLQPGSAGAGDALDVGVVGLGATGAFTSVEGATSGSFGLEGAYFTGLGAFRPRFAVGVGYRRVADLDALDVEASVGLMRRIGHSSAHPFVAAAGGVRQEWIGSFSDGRFPLGFDVGLTTLASPSAAFTAAYRFRRLLDDPVSDYNEHTVAFGVTILFHNTRGTP
jgi:hypothetical protein